MTFVHGGETINGRRVIGRDGRDSVVTGVGKFELDRTSGQWVPSSLGGESAGSKPSRRAQSDRSGEPTAVLPAGSIAQLGQRQIAAAGKDGDNRSDAATDQRSSTQIIADSLSGIVRRPQGSNIGQNDNLEVKLNCANPTDSQNGSPSSLGNLMAQSIPAQRRAESERKEKANGSSNGANPSDSQSGSPTTLGNLISQSIAAQPNLPNEPKEKDKKIAGAIPGSIESASARPLTETPSQPFNGQGAPSNEVKVKKPTGGSAPSENQTGLLGGLLSQSISQAARPEGEIRDLDKKKPPSSPLGDARNDPPPPTIQSVGNVVRNIEPPSKPEPEVHGGTGQEQAPAQLARLSGQHTPSELAEDKIRNHNLYNLGQSGGPAFSNSHQVDNRDKEKEQFLSSGQIPLSQGRTPEQLAAIAQLANQVPAGGGGSPRPEESRSGEVRRVVENLNQLQDGNPLPQVHQQFNNPPRPEGGIAPVESFENRVARRLAEVVENPANPPLDPRQLLHPGEIYSNPPLRSERLTDLPPSIGPLPPSIGPRPAEPEVPVNPSGRPLAFQDLRSPEVSTVSRLPESQLSQRPAQDPTLPARISESPLPLRSAPDLPSVLRVNPEQIQTARPADPVPVFRAPELTVSPLSPRQAEQLYAPSNRAERIVDQPPPPLSSDRKTDSTNQPSLQERRAELVAPPPLSTTDKRQESAGAREFSASGTRLRDFLRDEAMPDLQRGIKEIGKEPLTLTFSGQKMELLKGLEQNLNLPGGKLEAIKDGLNLANLQRSDGVARSVDSGIAAKSEVAKFIEGTGAYGNQRVEAGKASDALSGSRSDATVVGEGKGITGSTIGNGAKTSDGLPGMHDTHTTIAGQREGEPEPSRRPEATGKLDNGLDGELDADEDGTGKKRMKSLSQSLMSLLSADLR
jgi:hypothetical protein